MNKRDRRNWIFNGNRPAMAARASTPRPWWCSAARNKAVAFAAVFLVSGALAGCAAGRGAYNRGLEAELDGDYDEALAHYEEALEAAPADIEYRLKVQQARFAAAFEHFENGRRALQAGLLEQARMEFMRARQLDPTHEMAQSELTRVEGLLSAQTPEETIASLDFDDRKELARTDPSMDRRLSGVLDEPISLVMTQDSRQIFETIAELAGLNVIFDGDFNAQDLSVELDNVSVYEALDIVALQTQPRSFWEPINQTTIIVSPDNTQKRQQYENHIVKTVYMSHSVNPADVTEAITAIRTILNMRFIASSSSRSSITMRDTPDRIAIAEKIIDDFDKSKPEVLVEATVLEVDRNTLRELGILPPQQTSAGLTSRIGGSDDDDGLPAEPAGQVNIRDLDNLNSGSFNITIPDSVARFLASDSRTRLVQNPSVRATDGNQAQIRIGSRVPVAQGSFQPAFAGATGTPVVNFTYVDVGVNMDITPRVLLNREISMQVVVQVQATAGSNNVGGVVLPVFTNRSVTHEIRLGEGETNILGGLITNTESTTVNGIPGLSRIPLLNRLFASETAQRDQTEIIVLLTPHIVRMPEILDRNLNGLEVGPETDTRLRALPDPPELPQLPVPGNAPEPEPAPGAPEPDAGGNIIESDDAVAFAVPALELEAGSPGEIAVRIDAENVSGADLVVGFDPSVVRLVEVTDGGFLSQGGTGIALARNIDTTRGEAIVSMERSGSTAPVSGTGQLLRLRLEGVAPGASALTLREFEVYGGGESRRRGRTAEVLVTVR